ncbi:phosphoribosyltransferase [Oenococcus alcoholitolerans]|uniref:Phosphoribosyltransferase n=1 Tax=Oenococcus alcoholitolerans TaxID=931074 RepID=A0ABR4XQ76_9LACO|nr:phosphoribosyltransferase [Oenococcus alcoholitolerans]
MTKYFYRTIDDLNTLIKENLARLQSYNFDLIVGLPRRGMIPATLIGLFLNKPVVSFNELNANLASEKIGYRLQESSARFPKSYQNILLVDDSTDEGTVFAQALQKLDNQTAEKVTTLSVYATNKGGKLVDLHLETLEEPKLYEWNILHKKAVLADAAIRFEGIIATNALTGDWIPITLPSYPVKVIYTNWIEKYRPQIESFLTDNGVVYQKLEMGVVSALQLKQIVNNEKISLVYENDPFITRDLVDTVAVYNVAGNFLDNANKNALEYDSSDDEDQSGRDIGD